MIWASVAPASISSPTPFPIVARASGETQDSRPFAGSASSSPTMRKRDRRLLAFVFRIERSRFREIGTGLLGIAVLDEHFAGQGKQVRIVVDLVQDRLQDAERLVGLPAAQV